MKNIEWNEDLVVNILDIDNEKKQLFEVINKFVDVYNKSKKNYDEHLLVENLLGVIEKFKIVFKNEERILREFDYPECEAHFDIHSGFITKLKAFRRWITDDNENFSDDIVEFIKEWSIVHIQDRDMTFGPYIRLQTFLKDYNEKKKATKNNN